MTYPVPAVLPGQEGFQPSSGCVWALLMGPAGFVAQHSPGHDSTTSVRSEHVPLTGVCLLSVTSTRWTRPKMAGRAFPAFETEIETAEEKGHIQPT